MFAPVIFLIALLIYVGVTLLVSGVCLLIAISPRRRAVSLRAAGSVLATVPGVIVYQILSLPFMAVLFGIGLLITVLVGVREHPMSLVVFGGVLTLAFAAASFTGLASGWRVAWFALKERSFSAGWRREFVIATWRRLRNRRSHLSH